MISDDVSSIEPAGAGVVQLLRTVEVLRKECPWNMRQSPADLLSAMRAEVEELGTAVESGQTWSVRSEAGDVLFNLISLLAASTSDPSAEFDLVAAEVSDRMRHRHPYVFGDEDDPGEEGAIEQWAALKSKEGEVRASRVSGTTICGSLRSPWARSFGEARLIELCRAVLESISERPADVLELERSEQALVLRACSKESVIVVISDPLTGAVTFTGVRRAVDVPPGWADDLRRRTGAVELTVMVSEVAKGE